MVVRGMIIACGLYANMRHGHYILITRVTCVGLAFMLWHGGGVRVYCRTDSPSHDLFRNWVSFHPCIVDWCLVRSWRSGLYHRTYVSFSVSEYSLCRVYFCCCLYSYYACLLHSDPIIERRITYNDLEVTLTYILMQDQYLEHLGISSVSCTFFMIVYCFHLLYFCLCCYYLLLITR